MALETYLLRLALRRNYKILRQELFNDPAGMPNNLFAGIPDVEVSAATVQAIIDQDEGFDRYPVVIDLLEKLRNHVSLSDQRLDSLVDHAVYYAKMMSLLSKIGHDTTEDVTELLLDYFPNFTDEQVLVGNITQAVYSELRSFILNVLLQGKRSVHFARKKFPTDFVNVPGKLRRILAKMRPLLDAHFPPCELTQSFENLPKKARSEPAIVLYYERFSTLGIPRDDVTEGELLTFVRQIRESQLSVVAPETLILPTPTTEESLMNLSEESHRGFGSGSSNTTASTEELECVVGGSDDLFLTTPQHHSKKRTKRAVLDSDDDDEELANASYQDFVGVSKIYDSQGNTVRVDPREWYCFVEVDRLPNEMLNNVDARRRNSRTGRPKRKRFM